MMLSTISKEEGSSISNKDVMDIRSQETTGTTTKETISTTMTVRDTIIKEISDIRMRGKITEVGTGKTIIIADSHQNTRSSLNHPDKGSLKSPKCHSHTLNLGSSLNKISE